MFKVGDKVVCINNSDCYYDSCDSRNFNSYIIQKYHTYTIKNIHAFINSSYNNVNQFDETDTWFNSADFVLEEVNSTISSYRYKRFIPLKEYRKKQLTKINEIA